MENQEITFFKGTHRIIPPSKTIKNNESKIKTAGITRITEITHLDRIGIPVFSAIRPTAQDGGISIYGGKGITPEHAKASAMMEGFERYSAEKQDTDETVIAGLNEIEGKYIDPISLNLPKDFSKDLLESEIFGHTAGFFAGAITETKGLFEEANGGTIFLDEIGEMDISLQTRLLRVLETGQFMKIGSTYSNTCRCPSYSSNKSRFGTRNS